MSSSVANELCRIDLVNHSPLLSVRAAKLPTLATPMRLHLLSAIILLAFFTGPASATTTDEKVIYQEQPGPAVWSDPAVATMTSDAQPFHGPFRIQTVTLALDQLPPHCWIKISFDLLILGSWDGSSRVWGPDLWSLSVRGGPRLVFSSFSNAGIYANNNEQSFPDEYPIAIYPAWTGAAQKYAPGQLYQNPLAPEPSVFPDSVYHLEVLCPHQDATALFDFSGIFDDPEPEQCWGLANVTVSVATADPTPASALPALWDDLGSPDAARANAALWQCVGAGQSVVDFIAAQLPALETTVRTELSSHDTAALTPLGLKLHRLHSIVRIVGGPQSHDLCSKLEHLFPEYFGILPEKFTGINPSEPLASPSVSVSSSSVKTP